LFENALKLTEGNLKKDINLDSLNKINNNIIEIENEIINLTMLNGK
jgi:metallo-beta-lactamase family protein